VHIIASAQKLNPGAIANLALRIAETGGNVERIYRSASSPLITIEFFVSGATSESLRNATNSSALNSDLNLVIQENI
jgi:phosphoserine phosphatase